MTPGKVELNEIKQVLDGLSIAESLEILANVFVHLGLSGMDLDEQPTTKNIAELALKDIQKSGETLYNSILRQGLIILSWLDKEVMSE